MKQYVITTDSTADLPKSYLDKHGINVLSIPYLLEGVTYNEENPLPVKEFYGKMRNGAMPTTSQINSEEAKEEFLKILEKEDADILHICFSSGLSGTYNSVRLAVQELAEEDPKHKIIAIDSLGASLGEGLLVHLAIQNKANGMSLEENAEWLEAHKLHVVHNFIVDDLLHLQRGGRVSKTAAVIGTMINLKPILHVDEEGRLVPLEKVRGRKKAMASLVDLMDKQMGSYRGKSKTFFISHGDCEEDARHLADMIKQRYGFDDPLIHYVGPTIGAHAGPGTIALFYLGDKR